MRAAIAAIFFLFIACPTTLAGLYLLSANTWLTDREFYTDILNNPDLYEGDVSTGLLAASIAFEVTGTEPGSSNNSGPGSDTDTRFEQTLVALTRGIDAVTAEDYPRDEFNAVVDDVLDYVNDDTDMLDFSVTLLPVKSALRESEAETFAEAYTAHLPDCVGDDQFSRGLILPDCITGAEPADTEQLVIENIPAFVNMMPDELTTEVDIPFGDILDAIRLGTIWVMVFAVGLLLLNAFLGGEGRRGFLIWLGFLLLIPALLVLVSGSGIQNGLADNSVEDGVRTLEFTGMTVTDDFLDALSVTAVDALQDIALGLLLVGGAATVIAAILIGLGFASPGGSRYDDDYDLRSGYVNVPDRRV